jgi:hypothetical protein
VRVAVQVVTNPVVVTMVVDATSCSFCVAQSAQRRHCVPPGSAAFFWPVRHAAVAAIAAAVRALPVLWLVQQVYAVQGGFGRAQVMCLPVQELLLPGNSCAAFAQVQWLSAAEGVQMSWACLEWQLEERPCLFLQSGCM